VILALLTLNYATLVLGDTDTPTAPGLIVYPSPTPLPGLEESLIDGARTLGFDFGADVVDIGRLGHPVSVKMSGRRIVVTLGQVSSTLVDDGDAHDDQFRDVCRAHGHVYLAFVARPWPPEDFDQLYRRMADDGTAIPYAVLRVPITVLPADPYAN
jgi:hypothetical protein